MLLAAVEAVLASDLWHGSGALVGGLLLQTAMVLLSLVMRRGTDFSRVTAWVGVVLHGLDGLHIVAGLLVPTAEVALMMVGGPLYLVWFRLLAWHFFRLGNGD